MFVVYLGGCIAATSMAPPVAGVFILALLTISTALAAWDINKGMQLKFRQKNLKNITDNNLTAFYLRLIKALKSNKELTNLFGKIATRYRTEKDSWGASTKSTDLLVKLEAARNNKPQTSSANTPFLENTTTNVASPMKEVKEAMIEYLQDKGNHGKKLFTIIGEEAEDHFDPSSRNQINPVSPPQYP